jgi:hypothetical protein
VVAVGGLVSRGADTADEEQQGGQEVFDEFKARGEIVAASPLDDLVERRRARSPSFRKL